MQSGGRTFESTGNPQRFGTAPAENPELLKIWLCDAFCQVSDVSFLEKYRGIGQILNGIINFVMALGLLNEKPSKASPRHAASDVQSELHRTGSKGSQTGRSGCLREPARLWSRGLAGLS